MSNTLFVPDEFVVPRELDCGPFRLEPLGPEHNEADLAAWTSSIEHIRKTPGFTRSWPPAEGMTAEENLADLVGHAGDFEQRRGFTYTVLETGTGTVTDVAVGCVYIYPDRDDPAVTTVRSWVRADRGSLDQPLYEAVSAWLTADWPFAEIRYR
ncbi:N-acetyltransferase [Streptomyces sp. NBC_01210]|uniref:N-acetyltransferase n=1 Tax=Streptomyces sp. NBC_01210 TaxID=2903774 RepID=UPI002E0E219A|nr:N-acetyltransferase [Streptomyces sp. NBC_01210]